MDGCGIVIESNITVSTSCMFSCRRKLSSVLTSVMLGDGVILELLLAKGWEWVFPAIEKMPSGMCEHCQGIEGDVSND